MSSLSVCPTSTITRSCPSSVNRLSGTATAVTGDGGIPAYTLSQRRGREATAPCICAMVPSVATTRAPNRSASNPAANQWSPWPWVTKMSVRLRSLAATQSPRARA